MQKKTIAVVDDHDLFRQGIVALFRDYTEIEVVIEAGDGVDLMNQLKTKSPQVVLLDINMPRMDGITALDQLHKKYPNIKVIIISMYFEQNIIFTLMKKGAHGYLPKHADIDTVVDAVYSVLEKGFYFTEAVSRALAQGALKQEILNPFHSQSLTDKEIAVVKLICKQLTIKEMARQLSLSPRTIDSYIEKIYQKTGVRRREGIVMYAAQNNLL
jgi:DNA-binding NarL/FixJ family response regulator